MVVMYLIQEIESRMGLIPKRSKKFLYLQDWNTTTIGDLVGLSMLDIVVVPRIIDGSLPFQFVIFALLCGFAFTTLCFAYFLSPRHRPDSGVPRKGVLSCNGLYHAVYFFLQVSISFYALMLLASGQLPIQEISLGIVGGAIYLASLFGDWKKFKPVY